MAYVLKCDRCGKIVESVKYKHDPLREDDHKMFVGFSRYSDPTFYGLCDECMREVRAFFESFNIHSEVKR